MSAVFEKPLAYIEMEDYLVLENASRYKHEYLDGVIYAVQGDGTRGMAGGSAAHADLIRNVGFALHKRLEGSPCSVKMSDMRLRIVSIGAVFYPDVLVHCSRVEYPSETLELTDAKLVVEVLSRSTQHFDSGTKLAAYRSLPGLQHIVLISSLEEVAWSCHRSSDGESWSPLATWPRGAALDLPSLGLALPWDEVYKGVDLGRVPAT